MDLPKDLLYGLYGFFAVVVCSPSAFSVVLVSVGAVVGVGVVDGVDFWTFLSSVVVVAAAGAGVDGAVVVVAAVALSPLSAPTFALDCGLVGFLVMDDGEVDSAGAVAVVGIDDDGSVVVVVVVVVAAVVAADDGVVLLAPNFFF